MACIMGSVNITGKTVHSFKENIIMEKNMVKENTKKKVKISYMEYGKKGP